MSPLVVKRRRVRLKEETEFRVLMKGSHQQYDRSKKMKIRKNIHQNENTNRELLTGCKNDAGNE